MNDEVLTKKLLALLTARSSVSHNYHWIPVLVLWSLGWGIMGFLALGGLVSSLPIILVLPFQILMLRVGPWASEEARTAKLEGLWSLSWLLQITVHFLMPLAGILSPGAGSALALAFLSGLVLLTGLLKQRRPLMLLSLLGWVGMPVLWIFIPEPLRFPSMAFLGSVLCGLTALFSRKRLQRFS